MAERVRIEQTCNMIPQQRAISILETQIAEVEQLMKGPRFPPEFRKWHRDTQVAIEKIFGKTCRHIKDFNEVHYRYTGRISRDVPEQAFTDAFRKGLANAVAELQSMVCEIQEYGLEDENSAVNSEVLIERICERFHLVAKQLRVRRVGRPTVDVEDEYDVQDLMHSLLCLHFDDIRPEEWTPSYAGASSRMDFLLKNECTVLETKMTRATLGPKQLGEELLVDIARYKGHPDCKSLVCFVYDPLGKIGNPRGLESDLSKTHDGLKVVVFIRP